ncbi:MAG: class I SAM-dependent methyltransferase [Candidatus Marinamargulisbacteria bacterium]
MWDQRYQSSEYAYGESPNDYLKSQIKRFKKDAHILLPADGEGRNGVFLARQGFKVTTFDQSAVGCKKAELLAKKFDVDLSIHHDSLNTFSFSAYDGIILCFFHLPPNDRVRLHHICQQALNPNGILVLNGFDVSQLPLSSGGPKDPAMLFTTDIIQNDFQQLSILELSHYSYMLNEGPFHQGAAELVGFVGQKQ